MNPKESDAHYCLEAATLLSFKEVDLGQKYETLTSFFFHWPTE